MAKEAKDTKEEVVDETPVYNYYHKKHGDRGYVGAFILIFIGTILLLNNLELLPWLVWNELWKFWPLIIILIGIQILLGKSWLARALISLITLSTLAGVLIYVLVSSGLIVFPPLH